MYKERKKERRKERKNERKKERKKENKANVIEENNGTWFLKSS